MTRIRRTALLLLLTAAVALSTSTAALADYADTSTLTRAASVTTLTVAPPTKVSLGKTRCESNVDPVTGVTTTTMHARLDWNATTTTKGVTGYLVLVYLSDGSRYPYAQTNAATTALTGDYDASIATQNIRVSVVTLTSYRWTAESEMTKAISC